MNTIEAVEARRKEREKILCDNLMACGGHDDKEQKAIEMMGDGEWLDDVKTQAVECCLNLLKPSYYKVLVQVSEFEWLEEAWFINSEPNDHPIKGFEHRNVLGTQI